MPLTMDRLQALLRAQELKYFLDPDQPVVLLSARGVHGTYRFVIAIQVDGRFLQFRTMGYLQCPPDHPHIAGVLETLSAINCQKRLVKFGWDNADGEIVVYADMWIEDGAVTDLQFERMLQNFLPTVDLGYARIKTALETGEDPGDDLAQSLSGGDLPSELRELLEKLREGRDDDGEADDDDAEPYSTI